VAIGAGRVSIAIFRFEDLPEGFLSKPITEIVCFDEVSSVVTLCLKNERITWKVPSKPVEFVHVTWR